MAFRIPFVDVLQPVGIGAKLVDCDVPEVCVGVGVGVAVGAGVGVGLAVGLEVVGGVGIVMKLAEALIISM
jgi:hypothetical protein